MEIFRDVKNKFSWEKIKPIIGGSGPRRRKIQSDGQNIGKFTTTLRDLKNNVCTTNHIDNNKGWGLNEKNKYRFNPCYTDINDNSTLQFWFTIYVGKNIEDHKLYNYHNKLIENEAINW